MVVYDSKAMGNVRRMYDPTVYSRKLKFKAVGLG
jgi:hypothetical protein